MSQVPAEWKTLKPGVQVLRLWDTIGPEQPQIAILRLTSERYKELQKDLKAFVDSYDIFRETVRPEPRLTELLRARGEYAGEWTVSCFHRASRVHCASFPGEPEEK
jgi:hypothetical protein